MSKSKKTVQDTTANQVSESTQDVENTNDSQRKSRGGLYALPLGGLDEVGLNMMLYECGKSMIMVDCGITFPDETAPGTDVVVPDTSYVRENIGKLEAIIITHAHEDHIGGLPYLWEEMPVTVYLSKFARCVLEGKMGDVMKRNKHLKVVEIEAGEIYKVGPFELEFIPVTHSIPEGHAVAINTPYGTLVHTGDYKFDSKPVIGKKTNTARLKEIGKNGVLAMMGDSTNIFRDKEVGSESELAERLEQAMANCHNRIFFCTFASNLFRVVKAAEISVKLGRKICFMGRSMQSMMDYGRLCGYVPKKLMEHAVDADEAAKLPRNKIACFITGTQGEPNAVLNRLSLEMYRDMKLEADDTVLLSSKMIPGNERGIYTMLNRLSLLDVQVLHEGNADIHVSGHGSRKEIAKMYEYLQPQIALPIHGEYMCRKAQAELATDLGVKHTVLLHNGQKVKLAPGKPEIVSGKFSTGRNYVDGLNILDDDRFILKERRQLSFEGVATISIAIDKKGKLIAGPTVTTKGLIDEKLQADLIEEAEREAKNALKKAFNGNINSPGKAEETLRQAVRKVFSRERGRKPITLAQVLQ